MTKINRQALVVLLGSLLLPAALWAQRSFPTTDGWGYERLDANSGCATGLIDLSTTGSALVLQPSGAEPALDEGGAVLALQEPFEFYGVAHATVVVSSNGYLAMAPSLDQEDGGDFSNDCELPAIPGNERATIARVVPFHDDLSGADTAGSIYTQYFTTCPRASEALGTESCTVIQWSDWSHVAPVVAFDFEVVLYHQSFEIAFLYGDLSGVDVGDLSAGLQNAAATEGLVAACNGEGSLGLNGPAAAAQCFLEPRAPIGGARADLVVSLEDKREELESGDAVEYLLVLENEGPSPVLGASIDLPVPSGLEQCEFDCRVVEIGTGATACSASGTGAVDASVDLGVGAVLEYSYQCQAVATGGPTTVIAQAALGAPAGVTDPDLANNVTSDEDSLRVVLFKDGFESGATATWSFERP